VSIPVMVHTQPLHIFESLEHPTLADRMTTELFLSYLCQYHKLDLFAIEAEYQENVTFKERVDIAVSQLNKEHTIH
jgi:hypothetical protein